MALVKESDEDVEKLTTEDGEEVVPHGEVEVGSYKMHVAQAKKGLEYHIWSTLSQAVVAMAMPNEYHRIDLRNKEVLKRMSEEMGLEIDLEWIDSEIARRPYLVRPNSDQKPPVDKTKDEHGKPLTKKALKENAKREKIQVKIDALKAKHKKLKDKKCARAIKLKTQIEELETKRDRV